MKNRIALLAACLLFSVVAIGYAAADISGKYVGQIPTRQGGTREVTITLKAEGEKLTGTVSGQQGDTPISDGTIKGDDISFKVKQSFQGNEVTVVYTGKVSGDEIKFTRTREGGGGGGNRPPAEFTVKKAK